MNIRTIKRHSERVIFEWWICRNVRNVIPKSAADASVSHSSRVTFRSSISGPEGLTIIKIAPDHSGISSSMSVI